MKKIFKIVIALVLVLSLSLITACGKNDDKTNKDPSGSGLPIINMPAD